MTMHADLLPAPTAQRQEPFANRVSFLGMRIADWRATVADHYAAAAGCEKLSRLSNASLQRRGFWHATLAGDVSQDRKATVEY